MQKTSLEIVLTRQEAEQYHRAIHQALRDLHQQPPLTAGAYERTLMIATLMRLAALLDDAVLPPVPPPLRPDDPFLPEGNGSAHDVLLGRLYDSQRLVLNYLQGCTVSRCQKELWEMARAGLDQAWREYEDLSRG